VKTSLNFKSNGKMGTIDLYNKWKTISLLLLNNKESLKNKEKCKSELVHLGWELQLVN
jgi:hypothetical protein